MADQWEKYHEAKAIIEDLGKINETECHIFCEENKRLMPEGFEWPRFEDGEPVRFGDEFVTDNGHVGHVYEVQFHEDQTNIVPVECIFAIATSREGRLFKRPILAKDGKPIEVGETLYGEDEKAWRVCNLLHEEKYNVEAIPAYPSVNVQCEVIAKCLKAEWLTHEEPDSWFNLYKSTITYALSFDVFRDRAKKIAENNRKDI